MFSINIISDNKFLQAAFLELINTFDSQITSCSCDIFILDLGHIEDIGKITFSSLPCHVIFLLPRKENEVLFADIHFPFSVTYLTEGANVSETLNELKDIIYGLKRRVLCKGFYNPQPQTLLNKNEKKIIDILVSDWDLNSLVKVGLKLNYKTLLNYRTAAIAKAFNRLDVKGLNVLRSVEYLQKLDCIENKNRIPVRNVDCLYRNVFSEGV
ncbi:hypothetical protein KCK33_004484 [Salmonella enterica]|nr:hypothetical protein [Salmonella enterica]EGA0602488.1 hypothetical protein [Salmonella enterica]EHD2148086.1 hypothetical protein [Salmonella enterica]EHK2354307.1 hypothetical protein [Salmonella enterica]